MTRTWQQQLVRDTLTWLGVALVAVALVLTGFGLRLLSDHNTSILVLERDQGRILKTLERAGLMTEAKR